MAKLGSGGSRGSAQGKGILRVLLFLLLASVVQAVPPLASEFEHAEPAVEAVVQKIFVRSLPKEFRGGARTGFRICKIARKGREAVHTVGTTTPIPTSLLPISGVDITAKPGARHDICAEDWVFGSQSTTQSLTTPPFDGRVYVYPTAAAVAPPGGAVVGLGRGSAPKFSYRVGGDYGRLWLSAKPQQGRRLGSSSSSSGSGQAATTTTTTPLAINPKDPDDSRYYVNITGIRVGAEVVETPTELGFRPDGTGGAYLSTTEPYTYLESGVYGRLKAVLMAQIQRLNNPGPGGAAPAPTPSSSAGKLCYNVRRSRTEELTLTVPSMAIHFAGNAVMKLGAADNVWYGEGPSTVCLAILPTSMMSPPGQASVLGSWLQRGRMMTIDLTPAGGPAGTLTF